MGLNVGNSPVKQVFVGSTPVTAVYVGAEKIWPTRETVQITLGTGFEARDQLRAALADRGLSYQTVTEIPFDIELVGSGSAQRMFYACPSLTSVPAMNTSSVTNMNYMFYYCLALTHVPDMDTSNVTNMGGMFMNCSSLTDGNVRLIGRHPQVSTTNMITNSGLTREPFYTTDGQPWPTREVVQIALGAGSQARDQLRAALTERGLDYRTVEEIPFDIELVGTGLANNMFQNCSSLTSVPAMDTSQVTNMNAMFHSCSALTYVPDMDTSNVRSMDSMFRYCSSLTDGNVRLIGRHPNVDTWAMIDDSGLTRFPFYDTNGNPI